MKKANPDFLMPTEDALIESPTVDTSARHVTDQQIRLCGYEIASRPNKGPVIWKDKASKDTMTQEEVIRKERL